MKAEVVAHKPKIIDVNKLGQTLDRLIREGDSVVSLRPRYRSLQLGSLKKDEKPQQRQPLDATDLADYHEGKLPVKV